MSTISYLIPSPTKNEDIMPDVQEQEVQFEEGLPEELTEELTDQDQEQGESGSGNGESGGNDHSGSDTGNGDGETSMSSAATTEVEASNEQETIPSTFFSAMAYSIEAFLEAIDAQQSQALMNIDLYVTQVQNQQKTTSSLSKVIRDKIRLEAVEMFVDAGVQAFSGGISMYGSVKTGQAVAKNQSQLDNAIARRDTLQKNYDAITPPDASLSNARKTSAPLRHDKVGAARRDANDPTLSVDASDPNKHADTKYNLTAKETAQYEKYLKDDMYAMDSRIHGLHSDNQRIQTKYQIYTELGKAAFQSIGGFAKGGIHWNVAEKEMVRVIYESIKELISSILQQIQGRVSTTSKSALDGIDTLRNAIRQFQG